MDRVFFTSTALTQPAGSFSFNDWELLLLGATYAFTDNLQGTAVILPPIVKDMPFFGIGSLKARSQLDANIHIAAIGSIMHFSLDDDYENQAWSVFSLGGMLTACLNDECSSILSGNVNVSFASETDDDSRLVTYAGSLVHKVSRRVKLMAELASGTIFDRGESTDMPGFLFTYGLRFAGPEFAADVGFARPVITDDDIDDDNPFVLGYPVLTFTYRAL